MQQPSTQAEPWRPVGYVVVEDRACRSEVIDALHRRGWAVVEPATGFHLIQAISGLITGDTPGRSPDLIVIDAIARGCTGRTIAAGLRELGVTIPVVLVSREPTLADGDAIMVDPASAARVVTELAQPSPGGQADEEMCSSWSSRPPVGSGTRTGGPTERSAIA
jgi:CheY-like chemotaxis protein